MDLTQLRDAKKGALPVVALLALCLLWSLSSLRADLLPQFGSTNRDTHFARQAMPLAMLAMAAVLFAWVRGARWPRGRGLWESVGIGVALVVAPALLSDLARDSVSDLTRVALFSLVPLFAVVFEPYIGRASGTQNGSGLMAAMAAVAGTLCVFPIDLPESVRAGFGFCAVIVAAGCIAAANCWAVRVASGLPKKSMAAFVAIAGGAAAVAFAAASALTEHQAWSWNSLALDLEWSSVVELPGLLILFWLMQRMSATRMTTRFLLAPLIANLFGIFLSRHSVSFREWSGLTLIACGAAWLLFARTDDGDAQGTALHLENR
jgi:drug/metabolite transporter (DMT)-like permease